MGRLVHSADFERLRAAPAWTRSEHFAVHHLPSSPRRAVRPAPVPATDELSTGLEDNQVRSVDDLPAAHWLGTVLPKRLARRAVTRNLLRRQIRAAMERHQARLPAGLWVVRLRAPFARGAFVSAASDLLRRAARSELDQMLERRLARSV
jgi:ribonuclease P protein component